MRKIIFSLLLFIIITTMAAADQKPSIYDFTLINIDGERVSMEQYKGKAILIVNVASKCGYTYQYEGLESLYEKYKEKGFVILGFPTNDFLGQEPGTDEEIKEFCTLTYGVDFPMFSKIKVTGRNKDPLYEYLTNSETNREFSGRITWNFNKFLIDKEGNITNRFGSKIEPMSDEIIKAVEKTL